MKDMHKYLQDERRIIRKISPALGLQQALEVHEAHQQTFYVSGPVERVKGQTHMPEVLLVTVGLNKIVVLKKGKKEA